MPTRVLIVDDEESILDFLRLLFEAEGYDVATAGSLETAREQLAECSFELVLCDVIMPDGNGLDLLLEIKRLDPRISVIVMTAFTSTRSAIEAMRRGAHDYISKPFDVEELKIVVQKALERAELVDENLYLKSALEERYTFANIVGKSPRMQAIFSLVRRIARTTSTALIHGESGTGKELIARAIHFSSPRASRRFLSINCGAMPENLLESELFGHERGAFTGAVKEKKGLFHEAHQGTLFLDEIGEMPTGMQVKLLRVLQEKTVRKVGATREEEVDVRIIAATNQDLEKTIAAGTFREDLYYRINVIPIRLPPLRQRREDIPLLVSFFLAKFAGEMEIEAPRISVEAMRALEEHDWPGNVRELENVIERALALVTADVVTAEDLPPEVRNRTRPDATIATLPSDGLDLEEYLDGLRRELMSQALDRAEGVQTRAAETLGMTFRSFRYYARKLGLIGGGEEATEG